MIHQSGSKAKNREQSIKTGVALVLVLLCVFGLTVAGANAESDPLTIDARVMAMDTIDCSGQNLSFGQIMPSGVVGTVTVDTSGSAVDGGGATYLNGATEGECVFLGTPSSPYEIDYVVNDLTGPGVNMTLTNLVTDNLNGDGPFNGVGTHIANLDVNGQDALMIGATLNIGANQTPGLYTGTIAVTVNYP